MLPAEDRSLVPRVLVSKPVRAVALVVGLAALAEAVPGLDRLRVLSRKVPPAMTAVEAPAQVAAGETVIPQKTETRDDLAQPEQLGAVPRARGPIAERAPSEPDSPDDPERLREGVLTDASRSLDRFFAALTRTEGGEPGAVTRIVYFGDSVVASDFGTGTLRRLLQSQFGDAGHGFMLVASAWPQYFHNDVVRWADAGFRVSRIVGPRAVDGLYGLGGVSFSGSPGLRARMGTARSGSHGRSASRFELAYVEQPGGGTVSVRVDGKEVRVIDTDAPTKRAAFAKLEMTDEAHDIELLTARGSVRMFGAVLERNVPGVVLDAIGVVGARLRTLDESDDADFAGALAWRRPQLVAYQFGANESGDGFAYSMEDYHRSMKELLAKVASAVPEAGCLVVGAMDRARKEGDRLVTVPIIPHIVEEQRKVAAEAGCAFFDTYSQMGGKGSMAAWVRKGFGAGDYTHPTSWGAERLGKWIYRALLSRYSEYAFARQGALGAGSPSAVPSSNEPSSP